MDRYIFMILLHSAHTFTKFLLYPTIFVLCNRMRKSNSINSNFVIPKSLQNKCSAKLPLENNYQHDFLLMLFLTGTSNNSYNDCAILIGSHFYWTLIIIWHDYSKDTITNPWKYFRQWYLASIDSSVKLYRN